MSNQNTLGVAVTAGIVALIVSALALWLVGGNQPASFGGSSDSGWNATGDGCISVDGTCVITAAGVLTGTSGSFSGTFTTDGAHLMSANFATSSAGAATYTAANITGINSILHNATAALTATLPASSTLTSFVPNTGDRVSIAIVNIGAGNLTLAGGTGTSLNTASTSKVILPGGSGILDFVRKADTDIEAFFDHGI